MMRTRNKLTLLSLLFIPANLSALIVPTLAKAARVPYTNPIIGVVADNPAVNAFVFYMPTFTSLF